MEKLAANIGRLAPTPSNIADLVPYGYQQSIPVEELKQGEPFQLSEESKERLIEEHKQYQEKPKRNIFNKPRDA